MKNLIKGISKRSLLASAAVLLSLGLASCGLLSEPTLDPTVTTSNPMSTTDDDSGMPSDDGTEETTNTSASNSEGDLELTLDELAAFDGKDGQPAYVAVDGLIYDFSDLDLWTNGEHQGQFTAGQDLTEEIDDDSPHGRDVLERAPVVGRLLTP